MSASRPLIDAPGDGDGSADERALSFVVCVSDQAVLQANLLASPCLAPGSPHQVIAIHQAPSAAEGLNSGLERAKHDLVVCIHQDVFLPAGWDRQVVEQFRLATDRFGPVGVAGVYGVGDAIAPDSPGEPLAAPRIGRVADRGRLLDDGPDRPATVATLDELLLVLPRRTALARALRFDPELGFHLYGADLCLQARERGLAVVALEAPCRHESRHFHLPESFLASARLFARKWQSRLPVATPCVVFAGDGRMFVLGNARAGDRSGMARAVGAALEVGAGGGCRVEGGGTAEVQGGGTAEVQARRVVPVVQEARPGGQTMGGRASGPGPERGLTSVIVPCWNQLAFTRECLRALFRYTRPAWELIVVDNGSTDGTGEFLARLRGDSPVPVTAIQNAVNRGFPAAINQGLRAARGGFLVLLNNDAVVTDGWLDQLIALSTMIMQPRNGTEAVGGNGVGVPASAGAGMKIPPEGRTPAGIGVGPGRPAAIGLVGPMSNYASPPQLVEGVPYRDLDEMHAFAGRWRDEHRGQWFTSAKLSGFCLLMTRAVLDAIGGLDERFGLGLFDDDDLAERARRHRALALAEARRWDAGRLVERYEGFFRGGANGALPKGRRGPLLIRDRAEIRDRVTPVDICVGWSLAAGVQSPGFDLHRLFQGEGVIQGLVQKPPGSCRLSGGTKAVGLAKKAELLEIKRIATPHGATSVQLHQLADMSHPGLNQADVTEFLACANMGCFSFWRQYLAPSRV